MELAAWFLTFATAAAILYAVTRALAVALRVAIGVLVVAALVLAVDAYRRGENGEALAQKLSQVAESVRQSTKSAWELAKPWWDSATRVTKRPGPSNAQSL
jgi:phage-related minor tail protein